MKDIIISVILCVCSGTVISALCPKSSIGKPIVFLCSAVVTGAVISVFSVGLTDGSYSFSVPDLSEYDFSETANEAVCSSVEKTVAENLFSVVYSYLGVYPESVKTDVDYKDGRFYLTEADVFVETEHADALKKIIYEKTGLEVSVVEP